MTPEEKNIFIVEYLGWKRGVKTFEASNCSPFTMDGWYLPDGRFFRNPLNFSGSLDAMRVAESTLSKQHCYFYNDILGEILGKWESRNGPTNWIFHVSAEQKCDAFIELIKLIKKL